MSKKTNNKRINFATSKILKYPDLLEVQLKSFKDFFQLDTTPENRKNEGLYQVFKEIFGFDPQKHWEDVWWDFTYVDISTNKRRGKWIPEDEILSHVDYQSF